MASLFSNKKLCLLSRVKSLVNLRSSSQQKLNHTLAEARPDTQMSESLAHQVKVEMSKWKKVDARKFGITRPIIPPSPWIVLNVLRNAGFEAYLVGGCVRDLILNRVPKDFDVITTAQLKKVRKLFNRSQIVGRRFPICIVYLKGTAIEVSNFETVARDTEESDVILSKIPSDYDEADFARWGNSMRRDFTVNSLYLDPFKLKIYDYANGIADLRSLKLRTLIPAHLSFKEDCARILRGLRIAARLGLSFSKETESAISDLSSSIGNLNKDRLLMELNYMLSYGAAEASIYLFRRFNMLQTLLPLQAAYLDQQTGNRAAQNSVMLMKLFSRLDKLVTSARPSNSALWVGLLAFHSALVDSPQNAYTVWAFASTLYHGRCREEVDAAINEALLQVAFTPEIITSSECQSNKELERDVSKLAELVLDSVKAFTETDALSKFLSRYPPFPGPNLVFVTKRVARDASQIFEVLVNGIGSYEDERESYDIDYTLLGKGDIRETRFVIGKIITETLISGIHGGTEVVQDKQSINYDDGDGQKPEYLNDASTFAVSHAMKQKNVDSRVDRQGIPLIFAEQKSAKRQKLAKQKRILSSKRENVVERQIHLNMGEKHLEFMKENHWGYLGERNRKHIQRDDVCNITRQLVDEQDALQIIGSKSSVRENNSSRDLAKKAGRRSLHSLFK